MKKVLCNATLLLFISSQSFAYDYRKPVIQSASADSSEYYAFLSLNSDYMSFSDYLILKLNDTQANDSISTLYIKAKQYYYEKKYYKSILIFKEIVGLRNKHQLNTHSKKLVLNSLMKLYELSSSKIEQKKYLKLFTSTYPYTNYSDLTITEPLLTEVEEVPLQYSEWEIPQSLSKYNYLVINGKKHEIFPGIKIKLPKGEFMLSLISNSFYPIHKMSSKTELDSWIPNSEWMNSGVCDNPGLKVNNELKQSYVFYKHNCVIESDSKDKVVLGQSTTQQKNIKDLKPINDYSTVSYKPKKDYKWIKNKWLWIGLGALATTLIISSNQNKDKNSNSTKRGF